MTAAIHHRTRDLRPVGGWLAIVGCVLVLAVELRWLVRAEAGSPAVLAVCVLIAAVALAARPSSAQVGARIFGFAALVVAVPAGLLVFAAPDPAPSMPRVAGPDAAATSVAVSQEVFRRADAAVVAASGDLSQLASAASLAAATRSPLLVTPAGELADDVAGELDRLGVRRTVVAGIELEVVATLQDAGMTVEPLPASSTIATSVHARSSGDTVVLVADDAEVGSTLAGAISRRVPIVRDWSMATAARMLRFGVATIVVDGPAELQAAVAEAMPDLRVRSDLVGSSGVGPVWLAGEGSPVDLLLAAVAASVEDGALVTVSSDSLPELDDSRAVRVVGGTDAVPSSVLDRLGV